MASVKGEWAGFALFVDYLLHHDKKKEEETV